MNFTVFAPLGLAVALVACGAERLGNRHSSNTSDGEFDLTRGQTRDLRSRYEKSQSEVKRIDGLLDQIDGICAFVAAFNKDVSAAVASISADSKALTEKLASLKEDFESNREKLQEIDAAISQARGAIAAKQALIKEGPDKDLLGSIRSGIKAALAQIVQDRKDIRGVERKMLQLPEPEVYAKLSEQRDALQADIVQQQKTIATLKEARKKAKKLSSQEIAALREEISKLRAEVQSLTQSRSGLASERAEFLAGIVATKRELAKLGSQNDKIGQPLDLPPACEATVAE